MSELLTNAIRHSASAGPGGTVKVRAEITADASVSLEVIDNGGPRQPSGSNDSHLHGIVCPIRPGFLLNTLWQVTITAARQITGSRFETRPAVYHPHLSLAYATGHVDQDSIRAWLSDCDGPEIPVPVTGLVLVAQRHNGREITFPCPRPHPPAG